MEGRRLSAVYIGDIVISERNIHLIFLSFFLVSAIVVPKRGVEKPLLTYSLCSGTS